MSPLKALKESTVKDALRTLQWLPLMKHLEGVHLDAPTVEKLIGHVRRTSALIFQRPDALKQQRRAQFLEALHTYLESRAEPAAVARLTETVTLIRSIEAGYHGILALLEAADISALDPAVRTAACLRRAALEYVAIRAQFHADLQSATETISQGTMISGEGTESFSPDGAINTLVICLTNALLMEGYRNRWFGGGGQLAVPTLGPANDSDVYKAGTTFLLAHSWRLWKRAEERLRFLGGQLKPLEAQHWPEEIPGDGEVLVYEPTEDEVPDHIANERLADRFVQTYMEMSIETDMHKHAAGISAGPVPLPPTRFISAEEAHAAQSLSEALSYSIVADQRRCAGLRLIEWLRGYCYLKEFAALCAVQEDGSANADGLITSISRDSLLLALQRCGLGEPIAIRFIDAVTLNEASTDLFDCPLIATTDDGLLVFGPALLDANPAQVVLSMVARQGVSLDNRGKAFERDILAFLMAQGYAPQGFRVKRGGQEYDFDVILCWQAYVFLFECKSYGLSNNHPVQAYYFQLNMRDSAKQVIRLKNALLRYPDILQKKFGIDVSEKTIVPCVMNCLPYSRSGQHDGVYFSDSSVLKRFFEDRHLHFKRPHRIDDQLTVLHRVPIRRLWTGEAPCATDFLRELEDPVQLQIMRAHTEIRPAWGLLGKKSWLLAGEVARSQTTLESICAAVGTPAQFVRDEMHRLASALKDLPRNPVPKQDASGSK